ncbi:hypothetical protein DIURU_004788 [Diutina rugosa]|uniref:Thioredoxin domain-containing protein n=1 Tax=Diutina rugosa TaxID=5481 RepID=A0A642UM51_DIURU|nr:uncharacterized protein DIURU_004788 [Diutina rugosa]KAA8897935.1 hypothetical protein DIURU_004788 [Diutina rugosa]
MFRSVSRSAAPKQFVRYVSKGQEVPKVNLFKDSPGNEFNLADAVKNGKNVIVGVPGAFSPACSANHVPGYIKAAKDFKNKGYDGIYVVAVNDPFVTKAWADDLGANGDVQILSDPKGEFSKAFDALFDASKFFGNSRSKRYAALIQDGKVKDVFEEPDNVSLKESDASNVVKNA